MAFSNGGVAHSDRAAAFRPQVVGAIPTTPILVSVKRFDPLCRKPILGWLGRHERRYSLKCIGSELSPILPLAEYQQLKLSTHWHRYNAAYT